MRHTIRLLDKVVESSRVLSGPCEVFVVSFTIVIFVPRLPRIRNILQVRRRDVLGSSFFAALRCLSHPSGRATTGGGRFVLTMEARKGKCTSKQEEKTRQSGKQLVQHVRVFACLSRFRFTLQRIS